MPAPELEPHCGSWIVQCATTGEGFEVFSKAVADKSSEKDYLIVWTAAQWFAALNEEAKT